MKILNRKLFRNLKLLKSQVLTTATLVASGVALLTASWSSYHSLKTARDNYYRDYAFANLFSDLKQAPLNLDRKITKISGVERVDLRIVKDGLIDLHQSKDELESEPAVGHFISLPENPSTALNHLHLRQGRLPEDAEETEIAVHEGFASANHLLLGDHMKILIEGTRETVKIVGIALSPEYIYALSPFAPLPDDRHFGIIWMLRSNLERLSKIGPAFNHLSVKTGSGAPLPLIQSQIDAIIKPYGSLGVYGRELQSSSRLVDSEIDEQRTFALFLPGVFLSIAAFLIHIISSRLITLERPEIATLYAVGYTRFEISYHYLKLIFLMMLAGALPGLLLGGIFGKLMAMSYQNFFRFPSIDFGIQPSAATLGLLAGTLPGFLGSWLSIRGIFKLRPAEALRPPTPPNFHATLIEKWGLEQHLKIRTRMTLRNLLVRPLRLGISILGISTSLIVMITSLAWSDVLSHLLDTQFQKIQREDLSLGFIKPIPLSAIQEISHLPGVLEIEPYRSVPIRLHYLNHKKELALLAWPKHPKLRQLLDQKLNQISIPEEGLLLSRQLNRMWGIHIGDTVRVEVLDGHLNQLTIPVVGFSDDIIGISANVQAPFLTRLLKEEPSMNSVMISVDPIKTSSLYVKLKSMPYVATVSKKESLYRGFQQSMGTLVRVSTSILILFALAIAFGVIYNSIRVTFSERSWEMASLRVLGMDEQDSFMLLISEVGTQTLLSLAPGLFMGYFLTLLSVKSVNTEDYSFPLRIEAKTYAWALLILSGAFLLGTLSMRKLSQSVTLAMALKSRE